MPHTSMLRLLLTIALVALFWFPAEAGEGWTLIRSEDDIETYAKDELENGYREHRGVADLPAGFDDVVATLRDIPGDVEWLPDCRRSEVIRWVSDTEVLVYVVSNAPWPIKDRDIVWKRRYLSDTDDHLLLSFEATDEPHDGEAGTVRLRDARGEWEITRAGAEETRVRFQIISGSGGRIPKGFVNSNTKKLPHRVLLALREHLLQDDSVRD